MSQNTLNLNTTQIVSGSEIMTPGEGEIIPAYYGPACRRLPRAQMLR